MKNIYNECISCIHLQTKDKCFTCENKSNFEMNKPELHVIKFFLRLVIALIICITALVVLAYILKPKPIIQEEVIIKEDTTLIVTASVYHAVKEQCNSDYKNTAFSYKIDTLHPDKHRYIAVSRDLLAFYKKGDTVQVSGTWVYDGLWVVADKMNKRYSNSIDFLIAKGQYKDRFKDVKIRKY